MAISITHKFVSSKADGGDNTLVRPSNWNDTHTITMATARILGRVTSGTGEAQELTAAQARTLLDVPSNSDIGGFVPTSRTLTAGTGLTGGGNLTANRSFAVVYGTDAGTAAQGNDARIVNAVQTGDSRLSDSREWTASTVSQAEAQAGTSTTRRAWTAQRVKQAIEALAPSSPVGMYTGSSAGATTLPVGHHILVGEIDTGQSAATADANGLVSGVIRAVNNQYQIRYAGSGQLAGTWRGRGVGTQGEQFGATIPITALMQRVA